MELQSTHNQGRLGIITPEWRGVRTTASPRPQSDRVELSAEEKEGATNHEDPRLYLVKCLIAVLTGQTPEDVTLPSPSQVQGTEDKTSNVQITSLRVEGEYLHLSASGTLRVANGEAIAFSLDLSFTRLSITANAQDAQDPLVINLDGTPAKLSDATIRLDLKGDGVIREIPFVVPGKAIIAYDRNGDGVVNDGHELFGPLTGQGFSELATLDDDQNGKIDVNDRAFSLLRLWQMAPSGTLTLTSLAQNGITALGLASFASPSAIVNSSGDETGQIARTGFFTAQDGTRGTIQQVNLFI